MIIVTCNIYSNDFVTILKMFKVKLLDKELCSFVCDAFKFGFKTVQFCLFFFSTVHWGCLE